MGLKSDERGASRLIIGIAIAVAVILAAIVIPQAIGGQSKAQDAKRKADLKAIKVAIDAYYKNNQSYPSAGGISCAVGRPGCLDVALTDGATPYIDKLPTAPPGGTPYYYTPSPNGCTDGACVAYSIATRLHNGKALALTDAASQ